MRSPSHPVGLQYADKVARRASYQPLSHDDYDLAVIPRKPRKYPGRPSPLAVPGLLDRVKAQLRAGTSLSEIARVIGYYDSSAFAWAFERTVGLRPSKWLQKEGIEPVNDDHDRS